MQEIENFSNERNMNLSNKETDNSLILNENSYLSNSIF